ncbi:HU family DNA-binding protein [Robbsia sp. Bb-Pol-6]|uniref:HU family DNA-binding protein n=1 Tax=Robbsia betulipollinis TaxID=2981849 RepID=A0ABT3ZH32_9BURK|nr:HU family DNA-binding protein [Robbsia betulipollinis]MCY0385732.1 HU family DNA-binding protein [Robbsia betulipollinis]
MATATKAAKKVPAAKKAPAVKKTAAVKTAPVAKKAVAAKKTPAAKKAPAAKRVSSKTAGAAKKTVGHGPIKETFTKVSLAAHLAESSQVEPKAVKAVLAALEAVVLGAVHKKGAGEFTLPGLLKLSVQSVAAKKKRFGKDPFTGQDRWFDAKPASVRIKARALKKLKDAAA